MVHTMAEDCTNVDDPSASCPTKILTSYVKSKNYPMRFYWNTESSSWKDS